MPVNLMRFVSSGPRWRADVVAELVAARVAETRAKISAKRLLPAARVEGYSGSVRNFRTLVAAKKRAWRVVQGRRGHRPGVWLAAQTLLIDWGTIGALHVFCAVLAWSRVRFVRFARDETAATTLGLLAECFEELGGVPDRNVCAVRDALPVHPRFLSCA